MKVFWLKRGVWMPWRSWRYWNLCTRSRAKLAEKLSMKRIVSIWYVFFRYWCCWRCWRLRSLCRISHEAEPTRLGEGFPRTLPRTLWGGGSLQRPSLSAHCQDSRVAMDGIGCLRRLIWVLRRRGMLSIRCNLVTAHRLF